MPISRSVWGSRFGHRWRKAVFPFKRKRKEKKKSSRSLFTMKRRLNTQRPLKALTRALPHTFTQTRRLVLQRWKIKTTDEETQHPAFLTSQVKLFDFLNSNSSLFARARGNWANVIGVAVISSEIKICSFNPWPASQLCTSINTRRTLNTKNCLGGRLIWVILIIITIY